MARVLRRYWILALASWLIHVSSALLRDMPDFLISRKDLIVRRKAYGYFKIHPGCEGDMLDDVAISLAYAQTLGEAGQEGVVVGILHLMEGDPKLTNTSSVISTARTALKKNAYHAL
ncbi:MAG: hypothetical protein M1833_005286 [Piccolia ochrophora]|nr:MAG: hypothetical protein M1833_005286 [Piccolia ochrophora]